ncbi:hypothetical protein F5Y17DRAFT_46839 [Xylariaceae sp. FL0594]|nr:hypothetical protein F5Y17DRAFT_46839 [Xylariaceae sp. FL0594]
MPPDFFHVDGPGAPSAFHQGYQAPQYPHPQAQTQSQQYLPQRGPQNPAPMRGPTAAPKATQISDVSQDLYTESDMAEELAEYVVFRYEKMVDKNGDLLNEHGQPRWAGWEKAIRTEDRSIPKRDAAAKVRELNLVTGSLIDKKNSLSPPQKRQVDATLEMLIGRETQADSLRYKWELAQLDEQTRPTYHRSQHAAYYGNPAVATSMTTPAGGYAANSSLHRHHGHHRKRSSAHRSSGRKGTGRRHHSQSHHHAHNALPKRQPELQSFPRERLSLIAYFKRVPKPGVDVRKLWEEKKRMMAGGLLNSSHDGSYHARVQEQSHNNENSNQFSGGGRGGGAGGPQQPPLQQQQQMRIPPQNQHAQGPYPQQGGPGPGQRPPGGHPGGLGPSPQGPAPLHPQGSNPSQQQQRNGPHPHHPSSFARGHGQGVNHRAQVPRQYDDDYGSVSETDSGSGSGSGSGNYSGGSQYRRNNNATPATSVSDHSGSSHIQYAHSHKQKHSRGRRGDRLHSDGGLRSRSRSKSRHRFPPPPRPSVPITGQRLGSGVSIETGHPQAQHPINRAYAHGSGERPRGRIAVPEDPRLRGLYGRTSRGVGHGSGVAASDLDMGLGHGFAGLSLSDEDDTDCFTPLDRTRRRAHRHSKPRSSTLPRHNFSSISHPRPVHVSLGSVMSDDPFAKTNRHASSPSLSPSSGYYSTTSASSSSPYLQGPAPRAAHRSTQARVRVHSGHGVGDSRRRPVHVQ